MAECKIKEKNKPDKPAQWTVDQEHFKELAQEFIKIKSEGSEATTQRTLFPFRKDDLLSRENSWQRLCQEFIFVILQLAMKRVSEDEYMMATASSGGVSVLDGPQDIVSKLTLHRITTLGQRNSKTFKKR
jgi:hypothetical protein